jgi:hypothetical protein
MSTAPRPAQRDAPCGDATPHAGRDARTRRRPVRARVGAGPAPDVRPAPILAALAPAAAFVAAFVAAFAGAAHAQAAPVGLRPYAQVVPAGAVSDTGVITVHRVGDRWLFEVPDALTTTPGGATACTAATAGRSGFDGLAAGAAAGALARTDVPALARGELAAVRDAARRAAAAAPPGARRAHWADLAARVDAALARARAGTA